MLALQEMADRFEAAARSLDEAREKVESMGWCGYQVDDALRSLAKARRVLGGYAGSLAIRAEAVDRRAGAR